tara:strand:+ start:6317 stop:6976 length:660 start_codon:yes stop_codon:yes gene_type:complete
MGQEIDLLSNYPKAKRNLAERANFKTPEQRSIARLFGKEFFDGDRKHGYGGYSYNPKYWSKVVPDFEKHWKINSDSSLLDVGCGKGFMLYDFKRLIKGISVKGIDISSYAIENCLFEMKDLLQVGNAKKLEFNDNEFDYIISINTIHNLELDECKQAIKEISRVSRKGSFITVDAYNSPEEKKRMYDWNLTAKTILSVREWKKLFKELKYNGDYFWFMP